MNLDMVVKMSDTLRRCRIVVSWWFIAKQLTDVDNTIALPSTRTLWLNEVCRKWH